MVLRGYQWIHLSSATTTLSIPTTAQGNSGTLAPGRCYLRYVSINGGSTGAVTIYDNALSSASNTFAVIQAATAPVTMIYDALLTHGLTVTLAANTDVTIVWDN